MTQPDFKPGTKPDIKPDLTEEIPQPRTSELNQLDFQPESRRGFRLWPWGGVHIRELGPRQRERIARHLLALDLHDRYLRFGYVASDEQIRHYVDSLDFSHGVVFGIFNRLLRLVAVAHLAYSVDRDLASCAEFGVSVLPSSRGRGLGQRLFERAMRHARNEGVELMFIHALSENIPMLRIARRAGAVVQRDGSEARAYLRLPPATFDSRLSELIEEQLAEADYRLKRQARQFWDFLAGLQEVRQGLRQGQQAGQTFESPKDAKSGPG